MAKDRRPLLSYLRVQERWEGHMLTLLGQAAEKTDRDIRRLAGRTNVGAEMRRSQLMQARQAIHEELGRLWVIIGSNVEAGRELAAAAAIDATFAQSRILLNVPGMTKDRFDLLTAASKKTAEQGIVSALQRMQGASYRPLAESVYGSKNLAAGRVDRVINSALARGLSARELAKEVKDLIRPDVRGGVSYAAMRLGRTELNNAFHATQVRYAAEAPWVTGVKWNLSSSHPEGDECDDYDGVVFAPAEVPEKPHPNCLCYMTDEVMSAEQAARLPNFDSYIDNKMREAGYSEDQIRSGKSG